MVRPCEWCGGGAAASKASRPAPRAVWGDLPPSAARRLGRPAAPPWQVLQLARCLPRRLQAASAAAACGAGASTGSSLPEIGVYRLVARRGGLTDGGGGGQGVDGGRARGGRTPVGASAQGRGIWVGHVLGCAGICAPGRGCFVLGVEGVEGGREGRWEGGRRLVTDDAGVWQYGGCWLGREVEAGQAGGRGQGSGAGKVVEVVLKKERNADVFELLRFVLWLKKLVFGIQRHATAASRFRKKV